MFKRSILFLFFVIALASLCIAQSDSSIYKMKKVYFGIEVSPLVSFKLKPDGCDEFSIIHYNREASERNEYNSKFNKPIFGCKFAFSVSIRIYHNLYFKTALQFSKLGYKTSLIDSLKQTIRVYNKYTPSYYTKINTVSFSFNYHYFNVPIQLSYLNRIDNSRFILFADAGAELSALLKYSIVVNNHVAPSGNGRYNYIMERFIKSGSEYPTNYIFKNDYFIFYRVNTGVSYLLKNRRMITSGLGYSMLAPAYGFKSSLGNLSIDFRYSF